MLTGWKGSCCLRSCYKNTILTNDRRGSESETFKAKVQSLSTYALITYPSQHPIQFGANAHHLYLRVVEPARHALDVLCPASIDSLRVSLDKKAKIVAKADKGSKNQELIIKNLIGKKT